MSMVAIRADSSRVAPTLGTGLKEHGGDNWLFKYLHSHHRQHSPMSTPFSTKSFDLFLVDFIHEQSIPLAAAINCQPVPSSTKLKN